MTEHRHPNTGQPVGAPVDERPAKRPAAVKLVGRYGRLEKLKRKHAAALWPRLKGHAPLLTYMPSYPDFANDKAFINWIVARAAAADPYFYAIIDNDDRVLGLAALMNIRPDMRVIEVGNVIYAPALQRTRLATEAQYMLARYAFDTLGYRRYEWKCDALNEASRRAALRLGFTFEGIFRQHMIAKGRNRDTAWFAMLDGEWPARRENFEHWLKPENFSAGGKHKISLSALNGIAE